MWAKNPLSLNQRELIKFPLGGYIIIDSLRNPLLNLNSHYRKFALTMTELTSWTPLSVAFFTFLMARW